LLLCWCGLLSRRRDTHRRLRYLWGGYWNRCRLSEWRGYSRRPKSGIWRNIGTLIHRHRNMIWRTRTGGNLSRRHLIRRNLNCRSLIRLRRCRWNSRRWLYQRSSISPLSILLRLTIRIRLNPVLVRLWILIRRSSVRSHGWRLIRIPKINRPRLLRIWLHRNRCRRRRRTIQHRRWRRSRLFTLHHYWLRRLNIGRICAQG
jgi:hypothetical protein